MREKRRNFAIEFLTKITMKNKIFNLLKQEYAHLGLGDEFLSGLAESLANSGFVTDENIQGVVSAQKAYLESMQKSNDKRVQDAVTRAKKDAEDAQSAKIADLEKQLEEAKKQTPPPPTKDDEIPEWYKAKEKEREAKEAAYQKEIDALKKAKEDADKATADAEAARVAAQRLESINKKAKEKGIPDYIIKRGFGSLPADADEAVIDTYLSEYAQELKTNLLPGKGGIPQGNGEKADKAETDAMVAKLFPNAKKEAK